MILLGAATMVTILGLFLCDLVLAFISDQIDRRRAHRLELEREQTRRAQLQQRRDAIIWRQLQPDEPERSDQVRP